MFEKAGVPTARCHLAACELGPPLEVPLRMFDRLACSTLRRLERPQGDLTALQALRSLLKRVVCGGEPVPPSTASEFQADLLSCDRKQGADHAPIPPEACPVELFARPDGSDSPKTPRWQGVPSRTRRGATAQLTQLFLDHRRNQAGDTEPWTGETRRGEEGDAV